MSLHSTLVPNDELHAFPVSGCAGGIQDYVGGQEPANTGRQPESGTHSAIMSLAGAGLDAQTQTLLSAEEGRHACLHMTRVPRRVTLVLDP